MATYKKNPQEVVKLAAVVLNEHESHKPLLNAGVRIDYLFAYPRYNEKDEPIGDAIKHHGAKALGLARKVSLKDRTKGMGDAEILVDYEWWKDQEEPEQRGLLDHELHHLSIVLNKNGVVKQDDLGRPVIRLRPHDYQFGWFEVTAQRNGVHSVEQRQAAQIMENSGQFFWPAMMKANEGRFSKLEQPNVSRVTGSGKYEGK